MQGGYYRPMFAHRVEMGIGDDGMPVASKHVIVGQSWMIGSGNAFEPFLVKDGVDQLAVEGTADTRYAIPNFHVSAHHPTVNVPVLQWRSVGVYAQHVRDGDADRRVGDTREDGSHRLSPEAARRRCQEASRSADAAAGTQRGMASQSAAGTRSRRRLQRVPRDRRRMRRGRVNREQSAAHSSRHRGDRRGRGRQSVDD